MKKIIIISATTIVIGITSFAYFSSKSPLQNNAKAVESQQHSNHQKEEIPAFPKADHNAKKLDNDFSVVTNPESNLVLVNKHRKLPDGYTPEDLTRPNVPFTSPKDKEKTLLRKDAADALENMFEAAKKEGLELTAVSGYRSYKRQKSLHDTYVRRQGKAEADSVSAIPGTSEHQTGLAMDISSKSAKFQLEPIFGETNEGKWVAKHAHEFGFVIRYLEDKTETTEYSYEPWHLRYVGNPYATYIYKHHLTLEEAMEDKNIREQIALLFFFHSIIVLIFSSTLQATVRLFPFFSTLGPSFHDQLNKLLLLHSSPYNANLMKNFQLIQLLHTPSTVHQNIFA